MVSKPITLPDTASHIEIDDATVTDNTLSLKIDFRTFDKDRLLASNELTEGGEFILRIGQTGFVEFELKPSFTEFTVREIARSG